MNTTIKITAEQFIKKTLNAADLQAETDPDILIAQTIKRLYPNENGLTVRSMVLTNSIIEGIKKRQRQAAACENEFRNIDQLHLFGQPVPAHKVPESMYKKNLANMQQWMTERSQIEHDNAKELNRAAQAQEDKAQRFQEWSNSVNKVNSIIIQAGFDPQEISYEQALQKTQDIPDRPETLSSEKTKLPLR